MIPFAIERIYLDKEAEEDGLAQALLKHLSHIPVDRIEDKKAAIKRAEEAPDPLRIGKRNLLITRFYGRRLKPCPGTSNHLCCGYYVINAMTSCPMDCSYCVLQGYLNNPFLTLYTNWDDLWKEIDTFLSSTPYVFPRLGTGELSDSLALESVFPLSRELVCYFRKKRKGILELKTKSTEIDGLLGLDHGGRTVVSWSLAPSRLIREEEIGTAPFGDRLHAALRCQESGYPLGFHFDPMIYSKTWERDYEEAVHALFCQIDPKRVAWISLGGFRYPPKLKAIASQRFPKTRVFLGELFPGRDGKFRYLKEIRVKMYRKMVAWLRNVDPDLFVYLCMESREVWQEVFGWAPRNRFHLNRLFEERLRKFIP